MATPKYILDDKLNVINLYLVLQVRQESNKLIFTYPGQDVVKTYDNAADATTQFNAIKGMFDVGDISSITMLAPTITSINHASIAHATILACKLIGTRFDPTAVIKINSIDMLAKVDSSTNITFEYPGTIAAGTYDIVYSDALGRTATLVNGITLT
jgi:hypothetical protein